MFSAISFGQKINVNVYYPDRVNKINNDTIYYDINRKLTWADFKGKPDPLHFGGAITSSGFAFNSDMEYNSREMTINIYVYTYFIKSDSWKKKNIESAYHLEHEQKHFDITYLHARKFVDEIKRARFTAQNFKTLTGEIFNKVYDQSLAMQQQYDRETKHSINNDEQLRWNEKISDMLQAVSSEARKK